MQPTLLQSPHDAAAVEYTRDNNLNRYCIYHKDSPESSKGNVKVINITFVSSFLTPPLTLEKVYKVGQKLFALWTGEGASAANVSSRFNEKVEVKVGASDPASLSVVHYVYTKYGLSIERGIHFITYEGYLIHRLQLEESQLESK